LLTPVILDVAFETNEDRWFGRSSISSLETETEEELRKGLLLSLRRDASSVDVMEAGEGVRSSVYASSFKSSRGRRDGEMSPLAWDCVSPGSCFSTCNSTTVASALPRVESRFSVRL
jgi:hypothetical protein